jgi:integrase
MLEKIRYVTVRVDPSGNRRWYWQRRGHKLTRLPDNPADRMAMAERLNAMADRSATAAAPTPQRGTIGWVIRQYQDSNEFHNLAYSTLKVYRRFLRDIEALGPLLPFASFTRRVVVDFVESYPQPHQQSKAATVLQNLFQVAQYYGIVAANQAARLRLQTPRPRERIWSDDEVVRWLAAAAGEDPHMTTPFLLLQYTAQRPTDVLKMTWPHYSGSAIRLRQQKTKTLLDVPVHPVLRDHLDGLDRRGPSLTIVAAFGRPLPYDTFNRRFRALAEAAGIDAQARDLRRTAMLRMAEAGATVPQIASVSGHSIEATQRILEVYLPRNRELAEIAIGRLVEYKKRPRV